MHVPVLLQEVLTHLDPHPGDFIVDGTLGLGGHSKEILARIAPGGSLLGLDLDPTRLESVGAELSVAASRLRDVTTSVQHASYDTLPTLLADTGKRVDGLLLDLGFASDQLVGERGFSFQHAGPLQMTYDPGAPALGSLLQRADELELGRVIRDYGDERYWKRIARSIALRARSNELHTTMDLRQAIVSVLPRAQAHGGIDPATRTFQALRIWANGELQHLDSILAALPEVMQEGGRVAIISFHSLEDTRVAAAFRALQKQGVGKARPKFISASLDEVVANPRSRSARLRIFTFSHS